ncbi:MAG: DUF4114 domain-containing protein [Bacteroidales bacterium]|jgi:hypothetical protein|nr:DUF4114 domain-containing protein [Bacteroidales bacterium]
MKKLYLYFISLCVVCLASCNKDNEDSPASGENPAKKELMNGSIIINNNPSAIKVKALNEYPEGVSTENDFISASRSRKSLLKRNDVPLTPVYGNDYRFKLIAEVAPFEVDIDGCECPLTIQATHVKMTDDAKYAFVSYNTKGPDHVGAIAVFKITYTGSGNDVGATVENIALMSLRHSEISAIDYDPVSNRIYAVGANEDPNLGYDEKYETDLAFFLVAQLNADKTFSFNEDGYYAEQLTSYQGTSVKMAKGNIYAATGSGLNGTDGGLYIINATDYSRVKFIDLENARSVDVDDNHIYVMQAEHARINKYDLNGNLIAQIYNVTSEATQQEAKSEMTVWKDYIFSAMNESGLRMLDLDGNVVDQLDRPGSDPENHVTNSVALNSDKKNNSMGDAVESNLMLLANGGKGLYWYDIKKVDGEDQIVLCNNNSINFGDGYSANFVASKGNIVFVADGLGGLKVLYIDFNNGKPIDPPVPGEACTSFMSYLFNGTKASLLPESKNVFTSDNQIVNTLFGNANDVPRYIEVLGESPVFISYIAEGATFKNALGFFVVPAGQDIETYYTNEVKDNLWENAGTSSKKIKEKYIIFNNIMDYKKGGSLESGQTWQIKNYNRQDGNFNQGDRIVLFLAPNSWNSQNGWVNYTNKGYTMPVFTDWKINQNDPNYSCDYNNNFSGIPYNTFYSVDCKSIVLFFEDKSTGSDKDYNDMIFSVMSQIDEEGQSTAKLSKPKYYISSATYEDGQNEQSVVFNGQTLFLGEN